MLEDSVRRWNPWWAEAKSLQVLSGAEREVTPLILKAITLSHIKDVIGVRRSGKTTILYQIIKTLIEKKVNPRDVVFLNFDDPEINASSFENLLKTIEKINPDIKYMFLDEIQQKIGWERWVRTLYDVKKFKQVFISGSSASLLSKDIGRVLTGRHLTFFVFPFSFKEYLRLIGWKNFSLDFLRYKKNKLLHHLVSYIKDGGFPESINSKFEKEMILTNIFNDILARDISSKFNASYDIARKISYYLLSNVGKEFSFRSIAKSTGLSVETVEKYIEFLKETFMVLTLNAFSYKIKLQFKQNKKIYCIDTGLRNAISFRFSEDIGRLVENLVFMELRRRGKETYYWKYPKGEVDFLIKEGLKVKELIQVCWSIEDEKTKERELKSLLEAMKQFKLRKSLVITEDYDEEEKLGSKVIKYVPLWKWLLQSSKN